MPGLLPEADASPSAAAPVTPGSGRQTAGLAASPQPAPWAAPAEPGRLADTTAAVLVVYHLADAELLRQRLALITRALPTVVVVDNHERGHPVLEPLVHGTGARLLAGRNRGGLAGAYNLALQVLAQQPAPPGQVLFLDEDSDPAALHALLTHPATLRALAMPDTAALSPAYRDRATGLRGRYLALSRFALRFNPREFDDLRPVAFVINSMSLWRFSTLQRLGPYHEGLAVDHVDTEYCLRARRAGLKLYVNGALEFAHAIGERRKYRLFGVELQAGGHSAARRYMIGRNTSWLACRWAWEQPAFAALCLARLAYEAVGIAMAEDDRRPKLRALALGTWHGLLGRWGAGPKRAP